MKRSSKFRRHLTFANVASALALFLAVGGGTTAIALRGKNTVDSGDIKNRNVRTRDLAQNAVTGAKANESTFSIVPNASELDGISSEFFQFGNGASFAFVDALENGEDRPVVNLIDSTVNVACDSTPTVKVQDVADGATPTDAWVNGEHEQLDTDGEEGTGQELAMDTDTALVQTWGATDLQGDLRASFFYDPAPTPDLCIFAIEGQIQINENAVASASAQERASIREELRSAGPSAPGVSRD